MLVQGPLNQIKINGVLADERQRDKNTKKTRVDLVLLVEPYFLILTSQNMLDLLLHLLARHRLVHSDQEVTEPQLLPRRQLDTGLLQHQE